MNASTLGQAGGKEEAHMHALGRAGGKRGGARAAIRAGGAAGQGAGQSRQAGFSVASNCCGDLLWPSLLLLTYYRLLCTTALGCVRRRLASRLTT